MFEIKISREITSFPSPLEGSTSIFFLSPQVDKVPLKLSLLRTEQSQLSSPLFIWLVFWILNNNCGTFMDTFGYAHVSA